MISLSPLEINNVDERTLGERTFDECNSGTPKIKKNNTFNKDSRQSVIKSLINGLRNQINTFEIFLLDNDEPEKIVVESLKVKRSCNDWIKFTQRVQTLLRQSGNNYTLPPAVANQFSKTLKNIKEMSLWKDDDILKERLIWKLIPSIKDINKLQKPLKKRGPRRLSSMTVEERVIHDDILKVRREVRLKKDNIS